MDFWKRVACPPFFPFLPNSDCFLNLAADSVLCRSPRDLFFPTPLIAFFFRAPPARRAFLCSFSELAPLPCFRPLFPAWSPLPPRQRPVPFPHSEFFFFFFFFGENVRERKAGPRPPRTWPFFSFGLCLFAVREPPVVHLFLADLSSFVLFSFLLSFVACSFFLGRVARASLF